MGIFAFAKEFLIPGLSSGPKYSISEEQISSISALKQVIVFPVIVLNLLATGMPDTLTPVSSRRPPQRICTGYKLRARHFHLKSKIPCTLWSPPGLSMSLRKIHTLPRGL